MRVVGLGRRVLLVEFDDPDREMAHRRVLQLYRALTPKLGSQIDWMTPAVQSLTIGVSPTTTRLSQFLQRVEQLAERDVGETRETEPRLHDLPVCYQPPYALDQQEVEQQTGLEFERLVELHQSVEYRVLMMGFLPGFGYLGWLDAQLVTERKSVPRKRVPAGSVAIAGEQTGIYPDETPGGWQVIGRTPWSMMTPADDSPFRLEIGDRVRFRSIDRDEFEAMGIR